MNLFVFGMPLHSSSNVEDQVSPTPSFLRIDAVVGRRVQAGRRVVVVVRRGGSIWFLRRSTFIITRSPRCRPSASAGR